MRNHLHDDDHANGPTSGTIQAHCLYCQAGLARTSIAPDDDGERQPNNQGVSDETVDDEDRRHWHLRRSAVGQNEHAHEHVDRSPVDQRAQEDRAAQERKLARMNTAATTKEIPK